MSQDLPALMKSPEDDVEVPQRRTPGSFLSQLTDLRLGECAARAQRIEGHCTLADFQAQSAAWREALRNTVSTAVRHARNRVPGADYAIEVTDVLTASRNLFITAIVTRIA